MLLPVGSMRVNSTRLKPKTILMYRTWVSSDGANSGFKTGPKVYYYIICILLYK